ncbi:HAL [Mytilus edulis]|uniref:HutH n=1 Tax=Mytilus edulis TaxID=6550 RepID=A0A8S3RYU5_MYTED|nr:HAL [Mytilus edulis]
MKLSARVRGDWFAVPCKGGESVKWLGEETLRRYYKAKSSSGHAIEKVFEVRKAKGGAILDQDDAIKHVLDDNDFVTMTVDAEQKVQKARDLLEDIVDKNKLVYGITTGFGKFARVNVEKDKLNELQENLIRSHAAGVGPPLSPERTRMLLALRINVLTKGFVTFLNLASCLPWIPEKGTVGASGDLAPLSHLALGMMGEGKMWSPKSGWADAKYVLEFNNLEPIKLGPKEGLALINGTQLIAALGAEAVERAESIARQADVVAAFTLDVLKGSTRAFDSNIQSVRPHKGQINVASRLRSLLHSDTHPSEIAESHRFCDRVQDAYTLRCCPQVHGIVNDTIDFVRGILTTEVNSATDNPMVFADRMEIISGGNFHGEYPAKALDYLAIGVHELANMSERRIERLVNPVSENKVLCHPASVDSLTTSAGTEDHVSMGGFAARKCLRVVEHVEQVIAIELLSACQAMEFLRPLKSTPPLEEVYKLVRSVVNPWTRDRYMAPDIEAATKLLQEEKVWHKVKPFIDNYHSQQQVETRVFSPTSIGRPEGPAPKRRKTTSLSRRN